MPLNRETALSQRRVAIVGAGLMGFWHAHAVRCSGSHIVAVVDQDADVARRMAKRFRGLPYTSLNVCLAHERIDIAHICTPTETHASAIRACIDAGVSVLVEKPFSVCAKSTAELIDAATKQDVRLCPTHQYAFQNSVAELVSQLPNLGELATVDVAFQTAGGGHDKARWPYIAADVLPHPLSILQRVFPTEDLAEAPWCMAANGRGTWQLTAQIQTALVRILLSVEARPTCARIVAVGAGGTFEADLFHDYGIWSPGHASRRSKISAPGLRAAKHLVASTVNLALRAARWEPAYPGLRNLVKEFHQQHAKGVPISAGQIMQVARVRDWFLSSAAAGRAPGTAQERVG